MKRSVLILLFTLITLRFLHQLHFRTDVTQSDSALPKNSQQLSIPKIDSLEVKSGGLMASNYLCSNASNSYKDKKILLTNNNNLLSIGSRSTVSDKLFFVEKGLINTLNDLWCGGLNSIDVWIGDLNSLKTRFIEVTVGSYNQMYTPSISNIVLGLTLGIKGSSGSSTKHLFEITGTKHLFAISGFHLSFFVALVSSLYSKLLPKSMTILLNLLISSLYLGLIGISPGLLRAFLMFLISNLAFFTKRQRRTMHTFFIVLFIAITIDVQKITTIGFQLSYAATLGIIAIGSMFNRFAKATDAFLSDFPQVTSSLGAYFISSILISLAAQIAVFPLISFHFKEFSLMGIFATSLVAWTIPIIMKLGLFFALLQFLVPNTILQLISLPLYLTVSAMLFLLKLVSFNWSIITLSNFDLITTVQAYLLIILIYGVFFTIKLIKNIKKHNEIHHFSF
jgi:ComEC/Rec2-related protein